MRPAATRAATFAASAFALVGAFLAAASFSACAAAADPGCKAGNEKIGGTCRLLCSTQGECPSLFSCVSSSDSPKTYCKENPAGIGTGPTQFGSPCNATLKKKTDHPDCDSANGFKCLGTGPTDAEAYCSKYDCAADSECPGGFFCGKLNEAPNVSNSARSFGQSTTACMKRSAFCSPCVNDADCKSRGYAGPALHCLGTVGAKFCSSECLNDGGCNRDSSCSADAGGGLKACAPISGSCKGNGALCSRCNADADCAEGGYCLEQEYTKERACTAKPTGGACGTGACGAVPVGVPWVIGCAKATNGLTPTDSCVGLRDFGTDREGAPQPYIGCWAANAVEK